MQNILSTIFERCSVRNYTDQLVPDTQIETLIRAAMAAPSAKNVQPWHFVVVKETDTLKRLSTVLPYAKMIAQAPLAVAICGDTESSKEVAENSWVMDCSAATENLLLAAHAVGLGAVWTGVYPYPDRMKAVHEALDLPVNVLPLNVVAIGYPLKEQAAKDKWKPERIHFEKW